MPQMLKIQFQMLLKCHLLDRIVGILARFQTSAKSAELQ